MDTILPLVLGIITAGLGVYMCVTGDVRLLHSYHYATTPEALRPRLARMTGAGLIGCGASIVFLISTLLPDWFTILGTVLLVLSIAEMLLAIVRCNGGLMTFPGDSVTRRGFLSSLSMPARVAVFALIGVVCALFTIVPGVQMIATGDVTPLHSYHYVNVSPANLPRLATAEGACMIALGVALIAGMIGSAGMMSGQKSAPLWSKITLGFAVLLLCAALAGMFGAIIHFNGSLMG